MWSVRAVQYKNTVTRTTCNFQKTDDAEHWPPTFVPRLNMTVREKSWIQKLPVVKKQKLCTKSTHFTTLELPVSDTNNHSFIDSCWHRVNASSCTPMHVNMLLVCDYTNVTLNRPSNDASDRRRVKSCWEAMHDLLYAQRSGWIIERQNQGYDKLTPWSADYTLA